MSESNLHHYIGGKKVAGTSGRTGDIYNPATGQVTKQVPLASKAEVEGAIAIAQEAFPAWAATPPGKRAQVMFNFRDLLRSNMDRIAESVSSNHQSDPEDRRSRRRACRESRTRDSTQQLPQLRLR